MASLRRLRARAALPAAALVLGAGACASPGVPPGGPERRTPPMIVALTPDTNAVNVRARSLIFEFDAVVSERPAAQGAATLADLVLVSPRDGAPVVDWGRDRISVRPRRGWRRNTTYTVTLLPGVADLRGNARNTATEVTFSTGPAIPPTAITGRVFDALTGAAVAASIVEARPALGPAVDSTLVYVATTDSLGAFHMRGLPAGSYRVRGFVDQNRNRGLDPAEPFDSLSVALRDSARLELLAFVHDTTGPRLGSVAVVDSVTLDATFDLPLDPAQPLAPAQFAVLASDSLRLPVRTVRGIPDTVASGAPPPVSVTAVTGAPPSVVPIGPPQAAAPSRRASAPRPTRPLLFRRVRVTLGAVLRPRAEYRVRVTGVRSATGRAATSDRTFTVPAPSTARDSVGARARPRPR